MVERGWLCERCSKLHKSPSKFIRHTSMGGGANEKPSHAEIGEYYEKIPETDVEECDDCGCVVLNPAKHYCQTDCEPDRVERDTGGEPDRAVRGSFQTSHQHHGSEFQEQREVVLERDEYTCQAAGCHITDEEHRQSDELWPPGGGLHVHHIRPVRFFDNPEAAHDTSNLISVCGKHHNLIEKGEIPTPRPA